jgi:hypothetical protein
MTWKTFPLICAGHGQDGCHWEFLLIALCAALSLYSCDRVPDLLQEMIKGLAQEMMDAEVETLCGVAYGEVSANRVTSCNGYGAVNGTSVLGRLSWRS